MNKNRYSARVLKQLKSQRESGIIPKHRKSMPDSFPDCFKIICATFFVIIIAAGCATRGLDPYFAKTKSKANVYVASGQGAINKIAILPFKGPTELIGMSVSDLVVTEILRTGRYTLVERGQIAGVLGETEFAMSGLSESRAVEVAKMLGAEGVVIGTVDEYSSQARKGKTYAVVGVAIRLIDCGSGQIIWSSDLAKMADNSNTPTATQARIVVHEIMAGLYKAWAKNWSRQVHASPHAVRSSGSLPSAASIVPVTPVTPTDVTITDMGLREATLRWAAISAPGIRYRIERATAINGPFKQVGVVSASRGNFTDKQKLEDATVYYYRIAALGEGGAESEPSRPVETMTAPPPDPPIDVKATAPSSRCVSLTWKAPRSEGIARYRIERAEKKAKLQWAAQGETTGTSFTEGGRPGCDLEDSSIYLYRVTAINRVGATGSPSEPVEIETLPPPASVADFIAESKQVRCVPLSWKASPEIDVTGYDIERAEGDKGDFVELTKIRGRETTGFLDGRRDPGNLPDGQTFHYRIRAFNKLGSCSEWSKPFAATTREPPPAPRKVEVEDGLPRAVNILWETSPDEKVVSYKVQRNEGAGGEWRNVTTVPGRENNQLLDRGGASERAVTGLLKDGTEYRYRVCASNTAGADSDWSVEALAVTKPAPAAPTGLVTTTDRPGKIILNWKKNPEDDVVSYAVESRDADGARWRLVADVENCETEETGLKDGVQRVYRVKALDKDSHESGWSAEVHGSSRPLPDSPDNISAKWEKDKVSITWQEPAQVITEYRVYRKRLLSSEHLVESTDPTVTLDKTVIGKRATLYVTAIDEEGLESNPSETLRISSPDE